MITVNKWSLKMAFCETCPLADSCDRLDKDISYTSEGDSKVVLTALRTIFDKEGGDFAEACREGAPRLMHEELDGKEEYWLECSDGGKNALATYAVNGVTFLGEAPKPGDEFKALHPNTDYGI